LVAAAAATAITVADLKAKLIPNRILYPATGMVVVALVAAAALAGQPERITRGSLTGGAYFLVLLGVAVVSRGGFGMGDVKLGFLLGFLTGYVSLPIFLAGVFFTGIAGGIPAIALLLTRRARRDQELPYGPAMVVGTWAALTVGGSFLVWYQG
jgi:leader peptidase (prepilin peptidase)/N-methyltransferase